ncbi:hypothetical protein ACHQM5_011391 [Ranunculus cassubicifolius]
MVSERQKLARKKFKEENPHLFPKSQPTPPKDPNKKSKKRRQNRLQIKNGVPHKKPKSNKKLLSSKHPLRVPGMKPGESCFICKGMDHIAKTCPQKAEWEKNKICLLCRRRGHSLKNCPNKTDEISEQKLCYNCGETGHALSNCSQPLRDGGTKFASCFICSEQGHISKDCPKNPHGIYPKGGCCKECGGVTHLARDCPNKVNRISTSVYGVRNTRISGENAQKPTKIRFTSGDDLEDDFMAEEADVTVKNTGVALVDGAEKTVIEKPKKKQGPKVVNFLG